MPATHVDDRNFEAEVLRSELPVLVDFWAPDCVPCQAMSPTIDRLAAAFEGRAKVVKVNVYDAPASVEKLGVASVPNFVVINHGECQAQLAGMQLMSELALPLENLATQAEPFG